MHGTVGEAHKVVVCGWHRTGTTSLHVALRALGYRVHGFDRELMFGLMNGKRRRIWKAAGHSDAFRDFPWCLLYKEFDERFPGTKFILTKRDPEGWLESYKRHHDSIGKSPSHISPVHTWVYGGLTTPHGNEQAFVDRFTRHNTEALAYFGSRQGSDVLVFDVFSGDGWNELCGFLGRERVDGPFPSEESAIL